MDVQHTYSVRKHSSNSGQWFHCECGASGSVSKHSKKDFEDHVMRALIFEKMYEDLIAQYPDNRITYSRYKITIENTGR